MEFTKLDDIFTINIDNLKVADAKRLLYRIKNMIKDEVIEEEKKEQVLANPEELKYKAVSVVGDVMYILSFDPKTGVGKVHDTVTDSRGRHMAAYNAEKYLIDKILKQK